MAPFTSGVSSLISRRTNGRGRALANGNHLSKTSNSPLLATLGNVTFDIHLSGMPGAPEEWSVRVGLATELGQLPRIGEEAEELLNAKDTL